MPKKNNPVFFRRRKAFGGREFRKKIQNNFIACPPPSMDRQAQTAAGIHLLIFREEMLNSSLHTAMKVSMPIALETPDQAEVHELIAELDAYLYSLYPAESVYALDMASLRDPSVLFAVARDAAGLAQGCGAIVLNDEYGELKRMYVRPQARGQGLARALIETLEVQAAKHGCTTFMLETGPTLSEALMLYERLGYRCRGPFGDYPADPLSVFMQKNVA